MPHGQPDFGLYAVKETVFGQADIGELAVRLGSIVSYDRRGDVIFLEDFSKGLTRWETTLIGVGAAAAIANDRFRTSGFSCKLTTGSTLTGEAAIYRYFGVPIYSRIGLEVSFSVGTPAGILIFYIRVHTGTEYHQWQARYNVGTGVLEFWDIVTGWWHDVGFGYTLYNTSTEFHTLKLVGDFDTNKYVRLMLDDFSIDLSGFDCLITPNVANPYMQTTVEVYPVPVANQNYWLDDIIVTQNEP